MFRSAFAALTALVFGFSAASADEVKGIVKKVNVAGNSLTLGVNGKDRVLAVGKDATFVTVDKAKAKKGKANEKVTPIDGGLSGIKEGATVTVQTDKVGNKETVTSLKLGAADDAGAKKKAKKKENKTSLTAAKAKKADKAKGKKGKKKAKGKKSKKTSLTAAKAKKAGKAKGKGKKGKKKAKGKKSKKTSLTAAKTKKGGKAKGKGKKGKKGAKKKGKKSKK